MLLIDFVDYGVVLCVLLYDLVVLEGECCVVLFEVVQCYVELMVSNLIVLCWQVLLIYVIVVLYYVVGNLGWVVDFYVQVFVFDVFVFSLLLGIKIIVVVVCFGWILFGCGDFLVVC